MGKLAQILLYLANAGCSFFSVLLLLRFFMQLARAPFDSPIGVFVLTLTHALVRPLRRIIPAIGRADTSSLLAAYLLQILFLALVAALSLGHAPFGAEMFRWVPGIAIHALLALLRLGIYLYIGLLLAQAILSWFAPYAPLSRFAAQMCAPVLRPLRKIIPPVSGIDLSPLIALLLAQALLILLA